MGNMFEKFLGRKKGEGSLSNAPTFEELCDSLPEGLREEMHDLGKEVGGETGPPTDYFEGNYDDLLPEQRKYNDLLSQAKHAYSELGERI
jgi:hypothetical protein